MCEQSLAAHPFHPFCCKYGVAEGYADLERHVPELHDWVRNNSEAAPEMRCAVLDVVSWFPSVLQQLWIDVSVRCRLQLLGKRRKRSAYGMAVRALVFQDSAAKAPSCCVIC